MSAVFSKVNSRTALARTKKLVLQKRIHVVVFPIEMSTVTKLSGIHGDDNEDYCIVECDAV